MDNFYNVFSVKIQLNLHIKKQWSMLTIVHPHCTTCNFLLALYCLQ